MVREKQASRRPKRLLDPAEQAQRMLDQAEWAEQMAAQVPRRKAVADRDEESAQEERSV